MSAVPARPRRALVLGSDTRAFLTVVRSLGRAGIEVHVAWAPAHVPAVRSRYVAARHELPPAADGADAWVPALLALAARLEVDLVLPCDDPSLLPLQAERARLEPQLRVYLLSEEAFAVCNSKERTYALGASLGIALPRQRTVGRSTDAGELARDLGLPLALKPGSSFVMEALGSKREVRILRDAAQLSAALAAIPAGEAWLAQAFFGGVGVGVEVLAHEGEVLVAFQHRRVHEPLDGGGSSYRVSEAPRPELLEATRRLIAALRYTGVAMVEFKVDPGSQAWILVEINGRFWGSLPLAVAAGADFPAWLFQLLVEGRREFPTAYRHGVYARNWTKDLSWLAQHHGAWRRGRVASPWAALARELGHVVTGRERSDTFVLDDPAPARAELGELWRQVSGAVGKRVDARVGRLAVVRRSRAAAFARAWGEARRVVFVCKGNICRSPFAGRLAAAADPTREYRSAGYFPRSGRPSPDTAQAVAPDFGVDLVPHRSQVLTAHDAAWADLIVVFDRENLERVRHEHPAAASRVRLLGDVLADGAREIPDPYGGPPEAFAACYRRITEALARLGIAAGAAPTVRTADAAPGR